MNLEPYRNAALRAIYLYLLAPIDDWNGYLPEETYLSQLKTEENDYLESLQKKAEPGNVFERIQKRELKAVERNQTALGHFMKFRAKAFELADTVYKSPLREGPFICALPGIDALLIVWKLCDNGNCFVASPVKLTWLKNKAFANTCGVY